MSGVSVAVLALEEGRARPALRPARRHHAHPIAVGAGPRFAGIARQRIEAMQDAARQADVVRKRFPHFSPEEFGSLLRDPGQREKLAGALKKAGL